MTPIAATQTADETLSPLRKVCSSALTLSFNDVLQAMGLLLPQSPPVGKILISKAGEATYSEVFSATYLGCQPIMMKIIPLNTGLQSVELDMPDLSDPASVSREIQITQRTSGISKTGFVEFKA